MKIYCTTSDEYHHVLKVFIYLFNKFWGNDYEVIILGYKLPSFNLPINFKFYSMGTQSGTKNWCSDLRKFLETTDDDYFIMTMEDTFFKDYVDKNILNAFYQCLSKDLIRIDLTEGMSYREFSHYKTINGINIIKNNKNVEYKISTQMSIWNKEYLIKYLRDNWTPWDLELNGSRESLNDNNIVLGTDKNIKLCVNKNEGVRQNIGIRTFDFTDLNIEVINDMKEKGIIDDTIKYYQL
jgi:hypothetical protein